ncbi:hypothetical protein SHIRM173S_05806 [Streptomyces hirsutus]
MSGPCGVLVCEQAGGLDAIGQARRLVRRGFRLVMTGGTDASMCPCGLAAQLAGGRLTTVQEPERAYLPFDAAAWGHVPGEGGALLVLESAEAAAGRGGAPGYGGVARLRSRVRPGTRLRPAAGPAPHGRLRPSPTPGWHRPTSTSSSRTRPACRATTARRRRRSPPSSAAPASRSPRRRR